mmetsp:Transcript_14667/g.30562  ORF Transcript_14667/g.30562 Transcript_14667/m.30562 type:complete len:217 (-) Transcript_14667:216-866(-)
MTGIRTSSFTAAALAACLAMAQLRGSEALFSQDFWEQVGEDINAFIQNEIVQPIEASMNETGDALNASLEDTAVVLSDTFDPIVADAEDFFTEDVPEFFTETLPGLVNDTAADAEAFFTETVPELIEQGSNATQTFAEENLSPEAATELVDAVNEAQEDIETIIEEQILQAFEDDASEESPAEEDAAVEESSEATEEAAAEPAVEETTEAASEETN